MSSFNKIMSRRNGVDSVNHGQQPHLDGAATSDANPNQNPKIIKCSVHGVQLKQFERVLTNILPVIQPEYVHLPSKKDLSKYYDRDGNGNGARARAPGAAAASSSSSTGGGNTVVADNNDSDDEWPFSILPQSARVLGTNRGQLKNRRRALRKEGQIRSMLRCILKLVQGAEQMDTKRNKLQQQQPRKEKSTPFTIVDFGGGSGHLAIPLALLLQQYRIVVVDLNKQSLELMHEKAEVVARECSSVRTDKDVKQSKYLLSKQDVPRMDDKEESSSSTSNPVSTLRKCGKDGILENLFSFHGPVEQYPYPYDMALALHLCGQATDVALRKSARGVTGMAGTDTSTSMPTTSNEEVVPAPAGLSRGRAAAIVVAPCCVGKLSRRVLNPDIYHATGQNIPTVTYPQSALFCKLVAIDDNNKDQNDEDDNNNNVTNNRGSSNWDALAKAADYSNEKEFNTNRNASRRVAKSLLETDRRLYLEETYHYQTALMKMEPLEVTPKNDILIAWDPNRIINVQDAFTKPNTQCQVDIQVAQSQLLSHPSDTATTTTITKAAINKNASFGVTAATALGGTALSKSSSSPSNDIITQSDWTKEEEEEVAQQIQNFLDRTAATKRQREESTHGEVMKDDFDHDGDDGDEENEVYVFPTRMGSRKRKLIHFVAGKFQLAHWSEGKKYSEKTVAIARRRPRGKKTTTAAAAAAATRRENCTEKTYKQNV